MNEIYNQREIELEKGSESSDKFEGGVKPAMLRNDDISDHFSLQSSPKQKKEKDLEYQSPDVLMSKNSPTSEKKFGSLSANTPSTAQSGKSGMNRSMSRRSSIIIEPAKEHRKSYILSGAACVSFGVANYFMSDLSIRCGTNGVYTECFGLFFTWACFHIYKYVMFLKDPQSVKPYFKKSKSKYYEEFLEDVEEDEEIGVVQQNKPGIFEKSLEIGEIPENEEVKENKPENKMKELKINIQPINTKPAPLAFHILTWQRFSAPLSRCLVQIAIQFSIVATFQFASKSGVNGGIISTIFSSSCIFTIVIFYFKYGHQISKVDFFGTCFILLCVVLIALGGTGGSDSDIVKTEDQISEENLNLAMSLIFALISGLCLSMNTVGIQYTIYTGFELDQANYDGNFMLSCILLPFYIYYRDQFTFVDNCIGTIVVFTVTGGVILFSRALSCGIAGPVQAIENSKTVVQTVLAIIFLGQIPNLMQILGLVAGSVGVVSIVLQKKKDVAAKEIDTGKK